MMEIKERLKDHFQRQKELNEHLLGDDWRYKVENWQLQSAIISACGELLSGLGCKWIKEKEDWDKVKIGIVKVWSFLLSVGLLPHTISDYIQEIETLIEAYLRLERGETEYDYEKYDKGEIVVSISQLIQNIQFQTIEGYWLKNFKIIGKLIYLTGMTLEEFDELYRKRLKLMDKGESVYWICGEVVKRNV